MSAIVRSRPAALTALNIVVAAIVVWPWLPEGTRAPQRAAAPAAAEAPLPATLPPIGEFAAITARPLFSPSRRPPVVAQPATSALEERYRLLGLVIAGSARRALIGEVAGARRFEIGEGDAIDGWVARRIEPDAVLFASPAGEATLTLRSAAPPRKP